MEDNTEEIPVLMPGQGAFTREVLRRCVLAACSERETDGELTERAIEGIVDIVLDYLQSVGAGARRIAELQGRTRCNVADLLLGMRASDVAPAANPCAVAVEAMEAARAKDRDDKAARLAELPVSAAVAAAQADTERVTEAHTRRVSTLARRQAAVAGLGVLPAWAPQIPVSVRLARGPPTSDGGPTAQEAAEAALLQRDQGMQSLAQMQSSIAAETSAARARAEDPVTGERSNEDDGARRRGDGHDDDEAGDDDDGPSRRDGGRAKPLSLEPVIRWASLAATGLGAPVHASWGPPPAEAPAPHAKRARPADFGPAPPTSALATGGGVRREPRPSDPLASSSATIPGVDDGSAATPSLPDGSLRTMPPNPAAARVPRSHEVRASGFPGSGPSVPLKRIAEAASKEEILSGTFDPDLSGVAGLE